MALLDSLTNQFLSAHPGEAARMIEALPADRRRLALQTAGTAATAATLQAMDPSIAVSILQESMDAAPAVLEQMQLDSALLLLHRMDLRIRNALLAQLPASVAQPLRRRLQYPEGTAGSVMDPRTTEITEDITVAAALAQLRSLGFHPSAIVYVIDRAQRLVGVLTLGELFRAAEDARVADIMIREVRSIKASQTTTDVISNPGWSRLHRLPVVDSEQRLVGMIRHHTVGRLMADAARRMEQESGLGTLLSLGQLYWSSLAELLGGVTPEPQTGTTPEESGNE